MHFYEIKSSVSFGKYKGKTIEEILPFNSSYIEWCLLNVDNFYMEDGVIEEIRIIYPLFFIVPEWKEKLDEKYSKWRIKMDKLADRSSFKNSDSHMDQTDWSHYNDDLDMDQQSEEFWNQF